METSVSEVAAAVLNAVVLVIQFFMWRFLKKNGITTDASNKSTISQIADNLNLISRSFAAYQAPQGSSPPVTEGDQAPSLSEDEQKLIAAARKANLWRSTRR